MNTFKKYYFMTLLMFSFVLSNEEHLIYYSLNQGPNLVSFPIVSINDDIGIFFTDENANYISNYNIDQNIVTLISEGEFGFPLNSEWNGSLQEINSDQGYWIILDQPVNFLFSGTEINQNLYFFHEGANLISYPFSVEQSSTDALNQFFSGNDYAVIGENQALLSINSNWWGSLDTFIPGKGYWFIVQESTPFVFNQPLETESIQYPNLNDDYILPYNQSTQQSIFFIEGVYIDGVKISGEFTLNAYCNDNLVGQKTTISNYTDIVTMGSDGFDQTENYCSQNQEVFFRVQNSNNNFYILKGNNEWQAYNFNINILSNSDFGDINYNGLINITDIIIMVEFIIESNDLNEHQNILADINQDSSINIADVIINIETILNN